MHINHDTVDLSSIFLCCCSCHSGVKYSKIRLHGFIFFSNTGHRSWLVKIMWPLCSLALFWSGLASAESAFFPPILGFPSLLVHCLDAHQWASSSPTERSCDSCLPGSSAPTPQPCLKPSERFGSQCPPSNARMTFYVSVFPMRIILSRHQLQSSWPCLLPLTLVLTFVSLVGTLSSWL